MRVKINIKLQVQWQASTRQESVAENVPARSQIVADQRGLGSNPPVEMFFFSHFKIILSLCEYF